MVAIVSMQFATNTEYEIMRFNTYQNCKWLLACTMIFTRKNLRVSLWQG